MHNISKTKLFGWSLIVIGFVVFLEIFFHYYDTPFGYGNHSGLMVSIYLPIGILAFIAGIAILLVSKWRKIRVQK